ncbi:polyprenyl synthetase family protein, partial [candidate division KSB1 bacterium]|nr:polyprenyl synthetase family protein [candidate division KSB1 bacterium]
MNIDQFLAPVRGPLQQFEVLFAETLHSQIPLAERVVSYISLLKGKRLRPLLVFLSSDLHGSINDKSIRSAIVVELLHTATLVHDDVVDNSTVR